MIPSEGTSLSCFTNVSDVIQSMEDNIKKFIGLLAHMAFPAVVFTICSNITFKELLGEIRHPVRLFNVQRPTSNDHRMTIEWPLNDSEVNDSEASDGGASDGEASDGEANDGEANDGRRPNDP
jgi:hypothetical protein